MSQTQQHSEQDAQHPDERPQPARTGRSGEGAASAMQQLISQDQQRQQRGNDVADERAGQ